MVVGSKGEGRTIGWDCDPVYESDLLSPHSNQDVGTEPEWERGGTPGLLPRPGWRQYALEG
jgi:hypothetical protein